MGTRPYRVGVAYREGATFTFSRTTDWPRIRQIMTHPRVWPHITDDFAPPVEEFEPNRNPELLYLLCEDGPVTLGLFLLEPHGGIHAEVHTCLLPAGWVRDSRTIASQAMAWFWENCPQVQRLTTVVPRNNSLALRFAQALDMVEYGVNQSSFQKGGVIMDQTLLGISRPRNL